MSLGLTEGNESCWTPCLHLALLALGYHHLHLAGNGYDPEHPKLDEELLFCRAKRELLDTGEMWRWAEYKTCVILVALCKSFFFHKSNRAKKLTRWTVGAHPEYKEAWAHLILPGDAQWGHYIWAFSQPHITIVQPPLPITYYTSPQYHIPTAIDPVLHPNPSIQAISPSPSISTYKTQTQIDVPRGKTVPPLKIHINSCRSTSAPPSLIAAQLSDSSLASFQSSSSIPASPPLLPFPIGTIQNLISPSYNPSPVYLESESSYPPYAYANDYGHGYDRSGYKYISPSVEVGVNSYGYGCNTPSPSSNIGVYARSRTSSGSSTGPLGWESTQGRLGIEALPAKQADTPTQHISARTGAPIYHTEYVTFLRQSEEDDEKNGEREMDGEGVVYTSEYKKWYPGHVSFFASYLPPSSRALHDACRHSHSRMRFLRSTGGIERSVKLWGNAGFAPHPSSLASWACLFCPRAENQKRKAHLNEKRVADHGVRKTNHVTPGSPKML